jgi:hypothetical protein
MYSSQIGNAAFSEKINDPLFDRYRKHSRWWSYIFSGMLALIAVIAFPIYGKASGDLDYPASLYYGMGIGGMFLLIAFLQHMKRSLDKTGDGTVTDKKILRRIRRQEHGTDQYNEYIVKVRMDRGRTKKMRWLRQPGLYPYYNVGDRVRHHKGFYYYEKQDKTGDTQILCMACLSMNDLDGRTHCFRCKCPLLL